MILQILRHTLAGIQACFNLRMRNIASYNNRAVERKTGTNRVIGEDLANIRHRLIKVNLYGIFQSPVNNSVIVNNRISFYSFQLLHIESLNVVSGLS